MKNEDIYIDFISQTKIYDYEVGENQAKQFATGYEIKKNAVIKMKNIDDIDELVELAAAEGNL